MKNMHVILICSCVFLIGQRAEAKQAKPAPTQQTQSEQTPSEQTPSEQTRSEQAKSLTHEDLFDSWMGDFEQDMQEMHRSFERSRQAFKKLIAQDKLPATSADCGKVSVTEDEKYVTIAIPAPDLKGVKEISIVIEDGIAQVKVPRNGGETRVTIDERTLDVAARCLVEQKQKGKDGKEIVIDSRSSEYSTFEPLPTRVDITSIKPEYNEKNKILYVLFAKKEAKKVPVTITTTAGKQTLSDEK